MSELLVNLFLKGSAMNTISYELLIGQNESFIDVFFSPSPVPYCVAMLAAPSWWQIQYTSGLLWDRVCNYDGWTVRPQAVALVRACVCVSVLAPVCMCVYICACVCVSMVVCAPVCVCAHWSVLSPLSDCVSARFLIRTAFPSSAFCASHFYHGNIFIHPSHPVIITQQ